MRSYRNHTILKMQLGTPEHTKRVLQRTCASLETSSAHSTGPLGPVAHIIMPVAHAQGSPPGGETAQSKGAPCLAGARLDKVRSGQGGMFAQGCSRERLMNTSSHCSEGKREDLLRKRGPWRHPQGCQQKCGQTTTRCITILRLSTKIPPLPLAQAR